MTLSVPSFLAAATSAFMPPPAAAEESVDQLVLVPALELDEELDEHPAPSSAAAATPATANRYDDLTSASLKLPCPEVDHGCPKCSRRRRRVRRPTHLSPS